MDKWHHATYWKHRKDINPTIEHFGKIKAKPKSLTLEIVKREEGIAALVAYLDSKVAA